MKKVKQIVVAVLLVYLFGVQIASAITVGNGNVSAEAPVYTFYAGETELGYGNIAYGNVMSETIVDNVVFDLSIFAE